MSEEIRRSEPRTGSDSGNRTDPSIPPVWPTPSPPVSPVRGLFEKLGKGLDDTISRLNKSPTTPGDSTSAHSPPPLPPTSCSGSTSPAVHQVAPSSAQQAPHAGALKHLRATLRRTKLDMEACSQVASRLISDKVEKNKESPPTPGEFKPQQPIEQYRQATTCPSEWQKMSGTDQFRVCQECHLNVYDFTSMELATAESLVYTREGQPASCYYRRKDGRFLTRDCPVGVKRGRMMLMGIACGVLVVGGLMTIVILSPPPPPPPAPPPVHASSPAPAAVPARTTKGKSVPAPKSTKPETFDPSQPAPYIPK